MALSSIVFDENLMEDVQLEKIHEKAQSLQNVDVRGWENLAKIVQKQRTVK